MKTHVLKSLLLSFTVIFFVACEKEPATSPEVEDSFEANSALKSGKNKGFVHGKVVVIDGVEYYFDGPPDGPNGEKDVPGHYWVQAGPNQVVGKHYNTGKFGAPGWWSSDADDGALLYMVHGIIDTWSFEKAGFYASRGYVHRHEFVPVNNGEPHTLKVVWLKHTAVTSFTLDGGPGAPNPPYEHEVTPGIDLKFPNNGFEAYP